MPSILQIRKDILSYQAKGKRLFVTSSFQTHSIPMLHLVSQIDPNIPVYFLNTGYHFPETIAYKDHVAELFGIVITDIRSATPPVMQMNDKGAFLYTSDPDYCCYLNKIAPMESILEKYDVWMNGVRAEQNENRKNFAIEQSTQSRAVRYHPMLDWTSKMIWDYISEHQLPKHPLDEKGYLSVGCEPCTRHIELSMLQDERGGRWFGMQKTECGLHTELISKK
jgi:phosphoadenosine phosphosulfate reductase